MGSMVSFLCAHHCPKNAQGFLGEASGCRTATEGWYAEASHSAWVHPKDIKARYPAASFLAGNRVVFNIKGNKYRLIAHVRYDLGRVYIRFIGTHPEYDKVDVSTV